MTPALHPVRRAHPAAPATGGSTGSTDTIELRGLRATGHHGVLAHERATGQEFVVDVVLEVDTSRAARTDEVGDTVHYGEVAEAVHAVVAGEPVQLLERLAQRIADVVLAFPGTLAVEVAVHKPHAPIPVPFEDVVVRIHRTRPAEPHDPETGPAGARVVLALGSNLGERETILASAVESLARVPGLHLQAVSPVVETTALGPEGPDPTQQDYLNAVLVGTTTLEPLALLAACQRVEAAHGRVRRERWGARTLDVDVVDLGGTVARLEDRLELPHPRAADRAFVLVPWSLVDGAAVLAGPGGGLVRELAHEALQADPAAVRRRDDVVLRVPREVSGGTA